MLSLAVPNVLALPRQLSHLLCVFTPSVRDGWRGREGGRLLGEGVNNTNLHLLMCPLSTLLCLCIFYYDWYFFFLLPLRFFLLPFLFSFIFGLWSFIFIDSWLKKKQQAHVVDLFSIFYEPLTVPAFRIWHNFRTALRLLKVTFNNLLVKWKVSLSQQEGIGKWGFDTRLELPIEIFIS